MVREIVSFNNDLDDPPEKIIGKEPKHNYSTFNQH